MIKRFYFTLFFSRRFYWLLVGIIILFVLSYGFAWLFPLAQLAFAGMLLLTALDYIILFARKEPILVTRNVSERFSNGDNNPVMLVVVNQYPFAIHARIADEIPDQFQLRKFFQFLHLKSNEEKIVQYFLRPTTRGEYQFRNTNVFIKSPLSLVVRRKKLNREKMVKVLPSYFALRQFELLAHSNNLSEAGNKKIRKLGHSLEFEQIKEYVIGDDIRSINWKATGRRGGDLMVNNYTDEKSQQIYCLIDKGRVMKMPFEGLSLLDYAINAALVLSKVALIKQDKAGLVTFSEQISNFLPASYKSVQMNTILETLYNQQTKFLETDFEKLYALVRTRITQRSLLILFTNFESLSALQRQLPYIRSIAKNHLLLVIFFENTSLRELTEQPANDVEELYTKTIAEKFIYEKRLIVKELQKHGIATILTTPQQLSVATVNKYLEIKARQAI